MRNTLAHPIERDEILKAIEDAIHDATFNSLEEMIVGGTRGMILQKLYDRLANNDHLLRNVFGGDEDYKV